MLDWDPDEWSCHVKVHGILMLLGWGFFIPVAIFTNSHLYRRNFRHQRFGMHFHMAFITVGLVLSLLGFGYGIKFLTTFTRNRDHVSSYQMTHAVLGTVATGLAIVEVLLVALMRTVKSEDDRYETWNSEFSFASFPSFLNPTSFLPNVIKNMLGWSHGASQLGLCGFYICGSSLGNWISH
jgi:hypothetical protein